MVGVVKPAQVSVTLVGPPIKKKKKKKKKQVRGYVRVDLSCCRYQILRIALRKLGWEATTDDTKPWHLLWTDTSIGPDKLMLLKKGQKINHFVGMLQICRKKALARNLSTMRKIFPAAYKFFPRAFILPNQLTQFLTRFNSPKPRTYILKPDNGSQGRGVVLVQSSEEVKQVIKGMNGANFVAQKYLTKPMLLNGYKFDLRIYVLILSCDPLRLYLYKEGLARFCTEKYMKPDHKNLKVSRMHLTNYSLNKYSSKFEFNSSTAEVNKGSKWTLSALFNALAAQGHDTKQLDFQIKKMVVLTVIAIVPVLAHSYKTCLNEDDNGRSCFELLGLDVLVDEKCKPWLLEVNHSPSFSIDTPLDYMVKEALILDTLRLINIDPDGMLRSKMEERRGSQIRLYGKSSAEEESSESIVSEMLQSPEEYELVNIGNFDRIYPTEDVNLQKFYDRCLAGASELFTHSFDMKAKKEIAKVQEEKKQEELEKQAAEKKKKIRTDVRKKALEAARIAAGNSKCFNVKQRKEDDRASSCTPNLRRHEVEKTMMADPFAGIPERNGDSYCRIQNNNNSSNSNNRNSLSSEMNNLLFGRDSRLSSLMTMPLPPPSPRQQQQQQHSSEYCTVKHHKCYSPSVNDDCLTARGYMKSLPATMPEVRCSHCWRSKPKINSSSSNNSSSLLPFCLNDVTTLVASSLLTNRWNNMEKKAKERSAAAAAAASVAAGHYSEGMRAQFRSKLQILKPLQRLGGVWDSSSAASYKQQRHNLNTMLESTHLSPHTSELQNEWRIS